MTFTPGFNSTEAEELLSMLATLEGFLPPTQTPLIPPPFPPDWKIIYDSQQIGPFDNR